MGKVRTQKIFNFLKLQKTVPYKDQNSLKLYNKEQNTLLFCFKVFIQTCPRFLTLNFMCQNLEVHQYISFPSSVTNIDVTFSEKISKIIIHDSQFMHFIYRFNTRMKIFSMLHRYFSHLKKCQKSGTAAKSHDK